MKAANTLILAADIGNTSIHLGIFKGSRLFFTDTIPTKAKPGQLKNKIKLLGLRARKLRASPGAIVLCSVVPPRTRLVSAILKQVFKAPVFICGKNVSVAIKNLYKNPHSVGQDRLVNAFAGVALYGNPLIIIDFGTAITFDIVNKQGFYQGGLILPGIGLSLKALGQQTALLPQLSVPKSAPRLSLIGRSTQGAMLAGLLFGVSAMIEGLVPALKKELGARPKVILTGADAKLISAFLKPDQGFIVDEYLTLKGLSLLTRTF
jgi:type III pantothenate kinase